MEITSVLKTDYHILSEADWRHHPSLREYLEVGIVLVRDSDEKIIGAISSKENEIVSIGFTSMEMIQSDEDEWDAFPIWVVINSDQTIVGWIERENLYKSLYHNAKRKKEYYEKILISLPHRITVIDSDGRICFMSKDEWETQGMYKDERLGRKIRDVDQESSLEQLLSFSEKKTIVKITDDKKGIYTQTNIVDMGVPLGAIQVYWEASEIEKIAMGLEAYTNLAQDLKAVFESSYDVIYVSDGQGTTLRVSSAAEKLWGYKPEELVGKTVFELEKQGVYKPSITRLVLERKEKIQAIQTTKTGRRLMVVGTPIKDEEGNIIRVINTSRDITQESRLQLELEDTKSLIEGYKRELEHLRQLTMKGDPFVFKSESMRNVITLVGKVAEVDSTVLILGESGVGKEVIASYIHQNSARKDKPFIKVNGGAIPENLLESELFGYEKGAFTGASKDGKIGLFEAANEGTLFLDEIGEIPLSLQVKLLRVLQEKEVVRIGGTKPVQVNVRIIAATNRNLEEEVKRGLFREDLYYRLNVVPIRIPPLRERREDILPMVLHFIEKFNKEHNTNKSFSNEAMELLQTYKWPGNVRELQNIIERLAVLTDQKVMEVHHLPEAILNAQNQSTAITITNIIPLQDAIQLLERQLLAMAKEKYGTTTKIAEVLGVNQSTISRKINKLGL